MGCIGCLILLGWLLPGAFDLWVSDWLLMLFVFWLCIACLVATGGWIGLLALGLYLVILLGWVLMGFGCFRLVVWVGLLLVLDAAC